MTTRERKPTRLTKAMLETARDMRQGGILDEAAYDKITLRHLGNAPAPMATPLSGDEIRALRERDDEPGCFCKISQLDGRLCLATGTGAKRPSGPALALLNVIRRKGIEAIL